MKKIIITFCISCIAVVLLAQNVSIQDIKRAANQGNAQAQYLLGWNYHKGEGVPLDYEQAFNWWQKSAGAGYVPAMERLFVCYKYGYGVQKDREKTAYWCQKAAEGGSAMCQYHLGKFYMYGTGGFPRDSIQAEYWFLKSAEQQHPSCYDRVCSNLSWLYKNTLPNPRKAFYWLKKSADAGNPASCVTVGEGYMTGDYAEGAFLKNNPNYVAAFKYFYKAALLGNYYGNGELWAGKCFLEGIGAPMQCDSAFKYLSLAAYAEKKEAFLLLGDLYGGQYEECSALSDIEQATYWYDMAVNKNEQINADDLVHIGLFYRDKNYKKTYDLFLQAVNKYEESVQKGDSGKIESDNCYKYLAWCYMFGRGTTQDLPKAQEYITKYIQSHPDDAEGYVYLGDYYMVQQDKANAARSLEKAMAILPESQLQEDDLYKYVYQKGGNGKENRKLALTNSDVDIDIPQTSTTASNTFAVIIANEDYTEVDNVPYARNDGYSFSIYCQKVLGIPEQNIHFVENATLNKLTKEINWLSQTLQVFGPSANAIFYYAGHGFPDEVTQDAYLLPVDGYGNDIKTGYKISSLYSTLGAISCNQITIFMDACFSGSKREGGMLASARGVALKAKNGVPQGNMVVFSAAQGDETAYPNREKQHGMFTYYLLKKLQSTKGDVTLQDLGEYITTNVLQQSMVINGKSQTPCVTPSATLNNTWQTWKLK